MAVPATSVSPRRPDYSEACPLHCRESRAKRNFKTGGWSAYPAPSARSPPMSFCLGRAHRSPSTSKSGPGRLSRLAPSRMQSYLDEFVFRFKDRRTRHAAFRWLLGIAAGHAPLAYDMLVWKQSNKPPAANVCRGGYWRIQAMVIRHSRPLSFISNDVDVAPGHSVNTRIRSTSRSIWSIFYAYLEVISYTKLT
jgi:hypothetical protein